MKYYWINIDNYLDRNENMREQFSKYNLENYRIKAFTPDDMESIKIKKHSKANSSDNKSALLIVIVAVVVAIFLFFYYFSFYCTIIIYIEQ